MPIALPQVERSGTTPKTSCAPPVDQRNPVIISSNTSTVPSAVHSSRNPSRNPGAGATVPVAASVNTAAMRPGYCAYRARSESRSL